MPTYSYACKSCGPFEVEMSMKDATAQSPCPRCDGVANRVYSAIGLVTSNSALRRIVEKGMQPRVMKRDELHGRPIHAHHHHQPARPWQIGH